MSIYYVQVNTAITIWQFRNVIVNKHDKRHKPDDASLSKLLMRACEMHSNTSSGVILGRHKVSHMPREKLNINIFQKFLSSLLVLTTTQEGLPSSCSSQVPAATKSLGSVLQPMRSMLQMYTSFVMGSSPAMIYNWFVSAKFINLFEQKEMIQNPSS